MEERGARYDEVTGTVEEGQVSRAKSGRLKYTSEYRFEDYRGIHYYAKKQIEVFAVPEEEDIIVITVEVKYFQESADGNNL
jgi:hypothetical protein